MPKNSKYCFRSIIGYVPFLPLLFSSFSILEARAQVAPLFDEKLDAHRLTDRWELDSATQRGTFLITPYKPVYITAGRRSSNPNEQPFSENPLYSSPIKYDYGKNEAKFQLSFKTKVWQGILGPHGDLWVAYTQKSHWQIYNVGFSRPFRETNYEPEVILNFATNFNVLGFKARMMGLAMNHQSNGRSLPLSRSWNRVIAHVALERNKWTIYLRPWYRLPDTDDENPAITDYVGRGDATLIYNGGRSLYALTGSHSLRLGNKNRGQLVFDWTYRVAGHLKGHLQLSHGYGETLIDYNHRQSTIGIAVSLIEWL
ncbi:phospholipase A [Adhaeribacter radiodurans]|uniref:Phosphatidylcholine 1-acylhydrolase n=1 Tax=Adhaeribacter radiodurans TaxID=2745197 RepID=A0A7L7L126_9BACT|nr:phospholipase A [Adhaeribacter radiodurans]QMU26498.1 phospholipase A [Adhaeribacter radiodurans]